MITNFLVYRDGWFWHIKYTPESQSVLAGPLSMVDAEKRMMAEGHSGTVASRLVLAAERTGSSSRLYDVDDLANLDGELW